MYLNNVVYFCSDVGENKLNKTMTHSDSTGLTEIHLTVQMFCIWTTHLDRYTTDQLIYLKSYLFQKSFFFSSCVILLTSARSSILSRWADAAASLYISVWCIFLQNKYSAFFAPPPYIHLPLLFCFTWNRTLCIVTAQWSATEFWVLYSTTVHSK